MDLNQVAVFVEVAKAGSFTAAARALSLPKATVSRRVASLEAGLGVRLLNRTTRRLSLTDTGRRYYDACRESIATLDNANRLAAGEQASPRGTIRVSAPASGLYLSEMLATFQRQHDDVALEVILTDENLDLVGEGIDVALRAGQLADSRLVARKLAAVQSIVCASPAYLDRAGLPKSPGSLSRHDCIVHGRSVDNAVWELQGPTGDVRIPLRSRLAANSLMFAYRAAVAGLGLILVPEPVARSDIASGALKQVLPRWGSPPGGVYLVYPSNRHQSAAVRALVAFIAERIPFHRDQSKIRA